MPIVDGGVASAFGAGTGYAAGSFVYQWKTKANLPTGRALLNAGFVDSNLYVLGGLESSGSASFLVDKYDLALNVWTSVSGLAENRAASACGVVGGKIYMLCGQTSSSVPYSSGVSYEPGATTPLAFVAACPVSIGLPYSGVYGGNIYFGAPSSGFWMYDPIADTYTGLTAPSIAGAAAGSFGDDGKFHLFGGTSTRQTHTVYDPVAGTWAAGTAIPSPGMAYHGCVAKGGLLYILGGYNGAPVTTVQAFDPVLGTWTTKLPLPGPRYYPGKGATATPQGIYFIGGYQFDVTNTTYLLPGEELDGGVASARGGGYAQAFASGTGTARGAGQATASGEVRFSGQQMYGGPIPVTGQQVIDYWTSISPPH